MTRIAFPIIMLLSSWSLFVPPTPAVDRGFATWTAKELQEIKWQRLDPDGSKYALLEGDRDAAGEAFSYAFEMPDGVWVAPHIHSADARVFVVSGTLLIGEGAVMDRSKARVMPAGSFFIVPKNVHHWEGAKGKTLIVGVGAGPWATTYTDKAVR